MPTSCIVRVFSSFNLKRQFSRWTAAALPSAIQQRVVITGIGVVSPLGCGVNHAWDQLLQGKCGITALTDENYKQLPCQVAAQVPKGSAPHEFNLEKHFSKSDLRMIAPATAYAAVAAQEALEDANWSPKNLSRDVMDRTGVCIGMGMADLNDICVTHEAFKTGLHKVSPYFVPRILLNMASGYISMKYGFRGPNHSISTACASGAHAIGDSARLIRDGAADVMVCGGCEASINPLSLAAFCRLRALSTKFNDKPCKSSRPFDKNRDGFVMGEGAACLILEELTHAEERNAKIYAEVVGYGMSGDAYHVTSPPADGRGAVLAMQRALNYAGMNPQDVSYVNAHATSTPTGDDIELKAIQATFGGQTKHLAVSSTKGAHGHLLGASGSLESVFTVLACHTGWIPPTLNLDNPSEGLNVNLVPHVKQQWSHKRRRIALKNSFGFGSTNVSLCFAQYE